MSSDETLETETSTQETTSEHAESSHDATDTHEPEQAQESSKKTQESKKGSKSEAKSMKSKKGDESVTIPSVDDSEVKGIAAFFEHPAHLMYAAEQARDSKYEVFDALSPFPIHGMDDALGVGRSWIPWVTFCAGLTGVSLAACLEFGIMVFAWPLNIGGKPHASWPAFVPIMFELTVLLAGLTTVGVMFKAAGCFKRNLIIDRSITDDTFCLWIGADDANFNREEVIHFMKELNPVEIRTITEGAN